MEAWAPATETYAVQGVAEEAICLPLGSSAATGFSWELDLPPGVTRLEDALDSAAGSPVVAQEQQAGAGPTRRVCVRAMVGEYQFTARLQRPWDKAHPIRVAQIKLSVKAP